MPTAIHPSRGRLADFVPGSGEAAGAFRSDFGDSSWLELIIPTDVRMVLLDALGATILFGPCALIEEGETSIADRRHVGELTRS